MLAAEAEIFELDDRLGGDAALTRSRSGSRIREISYGAMERRVARLAGALVRRRVGISVGDRVAYLGQNAPELLDLLFACARRGAILVPLSARMPAPELEVVLANAEIAALLAEDSLAQMGREAGASLRAQDRRGSRGLPRCSRACRS